MNWALKLYQSTLLSTTKISADTPVTRSDLKHLSLSFTQSIPVPGPRVLQPPYLKVWGFFYSSINHEVMETCIFCFIQEYVFYQNNLGYQRALFSPSQVLNFFLISQLHLHLLHLMYFQVSSHIALTFSILFIQENQQIAFSQLTHATLQLAMVIHSQLNCVFKINTRQMLLSFKPQSHSKKSSGSARLFFQNMYSAEELHQQHSVLHYSHVQ